MATSSLCQRTWEPQPHTKQSDKSQLDIFSRSITTPDTAGGRRNSSMLTQVKRKHRTHYDREGHGTAMSTARLVSLAGGRLSAQTESVGEGAGIGLPLKFLFNISDINNTTMMELLIIFIINILFVSIYCNFMLVTM